MTAEEMKVNREAKRANPVRPAAGWRRKISTTLSTPRQAGYSQTPISHLDWNPATAPKQQIPRKVKNICSAQSRERRSSVSGVVSAKARAREEGSARTTAECSPISLHETDESTDESWTLPMPPDMLLNGAPNFVPPLPRPRKPVADWAADEFCVDDRLNFCEALSKALEKAGDED